MPTFATIVPPMPVPTTQTKSFLISKFRELGIEPATRHGQNFLIDPNLQRLIVDSADLGLDDVVLEVGCGTGSLTMLMAPRVAAVIGVEIDKHLFELASEQLIHFDNVTLLQQDVLKNKNRFDDRVLDTVRKALSESPERKLKLVANLPYNIATPVLTNLLSGEPLPTAMIVTIQKELGERIVAKPWTKDYNSLSIWIQCQCDARIIRIMPPSVFWPAPKVESAIIRLDFDHDRRNQIPNPRYFHQFIKAMFFHRRKFLRSNLVAAMKCHLSKEQVDAVLSELALGQEARAEQLDVSTLLRLCELIRLQAPDWKL